MTITRRNFIASASLASAFALSGSLGSVFAQDRVRRELYQLPAEIYADPLYSMTYKQFHALIGSSFTATSGEGQTIRLVLSEVNMLEHSGNILQGYYGDCFSLIFEGPRRETLQQGTYQITGDGFGEISALVVPTDRQQIKYEIIINRLTR